MKKYLHLLFFLVNLFSVVLYAQSIIRVRAEVDKSVITIGDRILYTLTVEHKKGIHIEQPGPGANLGQFEIKDYSISPKVEQGDFVRQKFEYSISVFDTGRFVIPPFPVAFASSDTSKNYQIIQSEPIEITVNSVLTAEDSDIKDIKPPELIPFNYRKWILLGAGMLLLVIAAILGIYILRQRKKGLPIFRKEVIRPAHEIALEQLASLENSLKPRIETGEYKAFYSELSNILRKYLENRFFIQAMEETTVEIKESLEEIEVEIPLQESALAVLQFSDMVKFAKFKPSVEDTEKLISSARQFIEATKLIFEAVERKIEVSSEDDLELEPVSENTT